MTPLSTRLAVVSSGTPHTNFELMVAFSTSRSSIGLGKSLWRARPSPTLSSCSQGHRPVSRYALSVLVATTDGS